MANTSQTFESIVRTAEATGDKITAYSIAVIINQRLREESITKIDKSGNRVPLQIRTQMMYNYDRNGLIVRGKKSVCHYSLAEALEFAAKYLRKYQVSLFKEDQPKAAPVKYPEATGFTRVSEELLKEIAADLAKI